MRSWLLHVVCMTCAVISHASLDTRLLHAQPQDYLNHHVTLARQKRYLLYPDGDPARVQLIIGLGLPVDLEDQSVTIGYVIKLLYHVPQNASDYSTNMFAAASIARSSRSAEKSEKFTKEREHERKKDSERDGTVEGSASVKEDIDASIIKENAHDNKDELKRNAIYTEGGIMTDDEADEDYKRYLMEVREQERREKLMKRPKTNRWDIYRVLEHMIEQNGLSGRACILRTICEAADTPFTYRNGLLGELVHIIFTPSSSHDQLSTHSDNEYHAAEKLGADEGSDCEQLFPECKESILEMFSEVGMGSMFG